MHSEVNVFNLGQILTWETDVRVAPKTDQEEEITPRDVISVMGLEGAELLLIVRRGSHGEGMVVTESDSAFWVQETIDTCRKHVAIVLVTNG